MSNVTLPAMPGLTWDATKAPLYSTIVQQSVSLCELRGSFSNDPVVDFRLTYDILRTASAYAELNTLGGFFNARKGSWDTWLYADPDDSSAVGMQFGTGTGDGVTVAFQLTRTAGESTEPTCNVLAGAQIYNNAVLQTLGTDYNISNTALVTFANAPLSNVPLTWTGTYYYRCRFKADQTEFERFMHQLWEAKMFEFRGCLGAKI